MGGNPRGASAAEGAKVERTYDTPGRHSEILKITAADGAVAYDFAVVIVYNRAHPERHIDTIHPNYAPTFGIRAGDGKPREMAAPETAPVDTPAPVTVVDGAGRRESDQDFERRTTAESGILTGSDAGVLPAGAQPNRSAPAGTRSR